MFFVVLLLSEDNSRFNREVRIGKKHLAVVVGFVDKLTFLVCTVEVNTEKAVGVGPVQFPVVSSFK